MTEAAIDVAAAEATVIPVEELGLPKGQEWPRQDPGSRRDLPVRERTGPGHQLVGRTRRIVGGDRVIQEGLVLVVEQLRVVLHADPTGKRVVVVCRQADQGENLAGLRVHDDHDTALEACRLHPPLERLLRVLLFLCVDRQTQGVARLGLTDGVQDLKLPARGVTLDGLAAVYAAELVLVISLETGLPEDVVREVTLSLQAIELIRRDRARVAKDLRQERSRRVLPPGLDDDLDAGQVKSRFRDQVGRFLRDVLGNPDEIETRAGIAVDRCIDIGSGRAGQAREPRDDVIAAVLWQIRRPDLDGERRHVRHQLQAVSIVDEATRRRDRLDNGPVAQRQRRIVADAHDLHVEQSSGQRTESDDHSEPEHQEPRQGPI